MDNTETQATLGTDTEQNHTTQKTIQLRNMDPPKHSGHCHGYAVPISYTASTMLLHPVPVKVLLVIEDIRQYLLHWVIICIHYCSLTFTKYFTCNYTAQNFIDAPLMHGNCIYVIHCIMLICDCVKLEAIIQLFSVRCL